MEINIDDLLTDANADAPEEELDLEEDLDFEEELEDEELDEIEEENTDSEDEEQEPDERGRIPGLFQKIRGRRAAQAGRMQYRPGP